MVDRTSACQLQFSIGGNMKFEVSLNKIVKWVNNFSDLLKSLFIFAVISGLLFNDPFGVLSNIGNLLGDFGDQGLAGLVSLLLIALWYKK
tara:strand:+ start:1301 stop:1570 length:270 start_codon:yes stop_codon:yes gene_type:complete